MFSNWWKRWGVVDVVGLAGGLVLSAAYIAMSANSKLDRTVLDLWPNIATEILGVWLSVRIIGAFISSREDRRTTRDRLAGNLNYLLGICQRLPRDFFNTQLADLQSEIGFYREKASLNPRSWSRHFTQEERSAIGDAFRDGDRILKVSKLARQALDDIRGLDDEWRCNDLKGAATEINHRLHAYRRSPDLDESQIRESISSIQEQLRHPPEDFENREAALRYCERVLDYLQAVTECSSAILTLEEDIRLFRRSVWTEFAA